jgi:Fe-S-cluster containining protein
MIREQQTTCRRCGTCCAKGGPALHAADLPLIHAHRLAFTDLITIRQGEPVFSPLVNGIEPSHTELIKVAGTNDSWTCRFFSRAENSCGIYAHRPQECGLLKCWDPSALTSVIYQECLTRQDILPKDEEFTALIAIQEEHCSFARIDRLALDLTTEGEKQETLTELTRIITLDLKIRQRAMETRGLGLAEELLYFGRPLFKSLSFYQLSIQEGPYGVRVIPAASLGT